MTDKEIKLRAKVGIKRLTNNHPFTNSEIAELIRDCQLVSPEITDQIVQFLKIQDEIALGTRRRNRKRELINEMMQEI